MPLEKEHSLVADSTASSSPSKGFDASEPTETTKRPMRTYGRRQQEPHIEDPDVSLSLFELSNLTRKSVHNTAPPDLSEEIPATSPHQMDTDTRDDDDESLSGLPTFEFGWKKMLRNQESDDEDAEMPIPPKDDDVPRPALSFGEPSLLFRDTMTTFSSPSVAADRDFRLTLPTVEDDIFSGSVSQRNPSPSGPLPDDSYTHSSPPPSAPVPSRQRRRTIIHESDSEAEAFSKSSPATASSSSRPHLFFSPKSASSSTQPTSDDEKMNSKSLKKKRSAGKKKDSGSRSSVAPLDFEEVRSSETKTGKKTKALSRQEQTEMVKERSRIIAQADVSISRTEQSSKHSLNKFFQKIQAGTTHPSEEKSAQNMSSDPIVSYTSPARGKTPDPVHRDDSDSDFEPHEIGSLLAKDLAEQRRNKDLMELKRRALAQRQATTATQDSDDDLEIVRSNPKVTVKEEEEHRRSAGKRPSEGRKRQLNLANVNPTKAATRAVSALSPIKKAEGSTSTVLKQRGERGLLNHRQLNLFLTADVQKQAQESTKMKEHEWQNHGGRVQAKSDAPIAGLDTVLQSIAVKGLKTAEMSMGHHMDMADDESQSDEEWSPENQEERGSASPKPVEGGDQDEEENDENTVDENMAVEHEAFEEGSKVRASRRVVVTSDSEEENDENEKPQKMFNSAKSSSGIITEEEEDKENNTRLMYDQSEDKENTAVVRHTPLTLPSRSLFNDDSLSPPLSPVHALGKWSPIIPGGDDERSAERRHPFKELVSEDSLLSTQFSNNLSQSFADKLQQTSPLSSTLAPAPTLKPLFSSAGSGHKVFSQFSDGEPDSLTPVPLLESGFSDLFESTTQTQKSMKSNDESLPKGLETNKLKRTESLHLTQDVTDLQPAFNVGGESLLRKANEIFEKEQAYIVEAAREIPKKKSRELYVNEIGFLTQTKPTNGSPELYRHSPSQRLIASGSRSVRRTPLRTLSMSSTYPESPEGGLRRLRKRSDTPPPAGDQLTLGRPLRALNAFDILGKGAQKIKKRETLKDRQDIAEFFENEAAESDEEGNFGFRKIKTADDEEEGEDLDQSLPELMDDKEMDQTVVAPERVHEKYMEQLEEQDKEDENFHQGLIQGQQRMKRRHGVGIDDSDDDSEEENNERARRALKKFKKSDRGDIKALEANEETRAFADAYNVGLKDDEDDFAYLNKDTAPQDIMMDQNRMDEDGDEDSDEDDDDDQENIPETFTRDELIQKLREQKEQGFEDVEMDPTDVSWIDKDEEEEAPRVKTINTRQRRAGRPQDTEQMEMGAAFRKSANSFGQSSKQWFAQENKSRNAGTSRSVGGSAITGHAKAKSKTNAGSVRKSSLAATASSVSVGKPVKAAASAISIISDKSRHFG